MKKINLIGWLSRNSHEKQSPQRFARYAAMLLLLVMCVTHAWAGTKRVYCQVTNNDWLDAGAKVNVHYWGGNSAGTNWPGAAMTATGTANVYYADIPDDVTNFVFARVNSGQTEYWGHKTSDLSFPVSPASGLNLYEITGNGEPSAGQWANIGFEGSGNDIKYYYSGNGADQTWDISTASGASATWDLGTITSLYLKGWEMKMYQNMDAAIVDGTTNRWLYYNIHRSAVSPGGYSSKTLDSWTWPGWSDGYRKPYGSKSCNENLLEGLGSGKYSMTFYLQHNGLINFYLNNGGSNYNLKWTIGVPAVSGGNVTSNGTGNGAEGSPFSVADGKTITFTAEGSQASTDANSVLYVKWGDESYAPASSTTKTITPTTTKQSMTVKLKYYNSDDVLSGAETTLTIWYQSTVIPSIGISSISPSPANSGDEVTITASRQNAGEANITYQYSLNGESDWTTIGSATSSTTQTWTVPAITTTTTYYFRAQMTYSATTYTSDVVSLKAYGKKTIKVKNTNGWYPFCMHRWGGDRAATSFPGDASQISDYGSGQWKEVVLYSSNDNFIFVDGTNMSNKNSDQTYAGVTDGACYEIASGTGELALNSTHNCPSKPTSVTTSAASSVTNTTATINGSIGGNGNDNITDYGFYWSANAAHDTPEELISSGTKVQKGTSNYTGSLTHDLTSLTAGNTIHYIAYATNGQGTTNSSPAQSFVVPHNVTISTATGCSALSPTAGSHYMKVGDNVSATAATGYHFTSWSTTNVTLGTPSTSEGVTTSSISSFSADNATIEPVYTANTYTVTFDATTNGGSCGTASKSVTYDAAYGDLPVATHASQLFKGWYTELSGGTKVTSETTVTTAGNHYLYAQFEPSYSVTIDYKCGDEKLFTSGSTTASATVLGAAISAPEKLGYTFSNWSGSNATFDNNESASTIVHVTAQTTITANYTAIPMVYFKNNLGWDEVYVTFDAAWDATYDGVPTQSGKPYFQMTQLGTSDIYYCRIPETYTASNYDSWAWNIAFDNKGFSASENVGSYGYFYQCDYAARGDFDPKATMYVPYDGDTESKNSCTSYASGCWVRYNSVKAGYKVCVNMKVDGGGKADTLQVELTTTTAGSLEFTATLNLTKINWGFGFKLLKEYQKCPTDIWYSNTGKITTATNTLPWPFRAGESVTATSQRCELESTSAGDYIVTVSFGTGKPMVDVEYPLSVGDYRVQYDDDVIDARYSQVIKKKNSGESLVSFFVRHDESPTMYIQKCTAMTAGVPTWENPGTSIDLSDITDGEVTGVFDIKVTQSADASTASGSVEGAYTGDYYIRTDAADGGWTNYKSEGNKMTYSSYADDNNKGFTHYFMAYRPNGSNIKYVIANDNSPEISDQLVDDSYTGEYVAANANIRYGWNMNTNEVKRSYLSGSSVVSDRFLVLEGDEMMFDEDGCALTGVHQVSGLEEHEMKFTDDQNWIYEATVKAQPGARVKLTAKFNNKIQYFYGAEGDRDDETTYEILGGSDEDETAYKLRIVYDFKIDRLVSAFLPEGPISTDLAIHADMMIIRKHQAEANQVTFGEKGDKSGYGSLSEVKTVYGAMQFNKWTLNSKSEEAGHEILSIPASQRGLYWISFPFDVNLSDVFGFGTYGRHWIIEEYNGAKRATDGYWADSDGFWEFVTNRSNKVLEAGKGYVLALDLNLLTESSDIWANNVENVYLYFPSSTEVENIERTNVTITVDPHPCSIDRTGNNGADINKNRTIADSHWNIIGVPSYANYGESLYSDEEGEHLITWQTAEAKSLPYLYQWNMGDNTYSVQSGPTYAFKSMHAYMVQYHGDIYWNLASVGYPNPPASVAARQTDVPDVEYMLSLIKDSVEEDHTFVRMSDKEGVTAGFEFGQDLCKEYNGNKGNIYTFVGYLPVAGNSQPHPLTTTIVPVGVKIAANGEYTFSMPEGTNGGDVWLIDNANSSRTNLGLMDYTVNLTTGTYEGRFSLEFPVQNVVTDIDNDGMMRSDELNDANDGVRKVFVGGRLYILRDGKAYDATGAQVR